MEWLYVLMAITAQGDTLRHTILNAEPKASAVACRQYATARSASLIEIEDRANKNSAPAKIRYHIVGLCMEVYVP